MKTKQTKKTTQKIAWWLWTMPLLVIAIVAALLIFGQAASTPAANQLPGEVSVKQAVEMQAAGAFVLDVRTQAEWNEYHAPNSVLVPLDQLPNRLSELPRDQEIVVVCRSGNRSATARDLLLKAGFGKVTSMAGGLKQWSAQGYPTLTGP